MPILTGSKRSITMAQWKEQINKHLMKVNSSADCFNRFADNDSLDHLIEDCEKIIKIAHNAKKALKFMEDNHG